MPRKKIPKKLAYQTFHRIDNPHNVGNCWHCGKKIVYEHRSSTSPESTTWQVDHYPVPHRDIENQICCGVTDTLDPENLVPACKKCNLSHQFEIPKWYYCNHYQFPCKKTFYNKVSITILAIYVIAITTLYIRCSYS